MRTRMVLCLVALVAALVVPAASPATAQAGEETAFLAALNQTRADVGLPALVVHGELTQLSRGWAATMAEAGEIFHANPISAGLQAPWLKLGENVGVGPTVSELMAAFRASPGHYANIVDPEFTHVGVGVVWSGSVMYTTHRFMKMEPVAAPPPPAPPPSTTPPEAIGDRPDPSPPPTAAPADGLAPLALVDLPRPVARPGRVGVVLRTLLTDR